MPNSQSESRCKPCQLENNRGLCDRTDCSNHKSPQEGWRVEFVKRFLNCYPLEEFENTSIALQEFIHSTIASELSEYKKSLVESVERLRKGPPTLENYPWQGDAHFNSALDEILAIIKNN